MPQLDPQGTGPKALTPQPLQSPVARSVQVTDAVPHKWTLGDSHSMLVDFPQVLAPSLPSVSGGKEHELGGRGAFPEPCSSGEDVSLSLQGKHSPSIWPPHRHSVLGESAGGPRSPGVTAHPTLSASPQQVSPCHVHGAGVHVALCGPHPWG